MEITSNFESLIIFVVVDRVIEWSFAIDWLTHLLNGMVDWLIDWPSHPLILPNMDNLTYDSQLLHTAEIFYYNCDKLQNVETFPHLQYFSHVWFIVHSRCYFTTRHLENFLNIFALRKCFFRFLIFQRSTNLLRGWCVD